MSQRDGLRKRRHVAKVALEAGMVGASHRGTGRSRLAIVRLARGGGRPPFDRPGSARSILDERYARGEIDDDEYRKRRETLG